MIFTMKYDQKGIYNKKIKKYLKIEKTHFLVPKSHAILLLKCLRRYYNQNKDLRKTVDFSFFETTNDINNFKNCLKIDQSQVLVTNHT